MLVDSGKQTSEGSLRLESKQNKTSLKEREKYDTLAAAAAESLTNAFTD